MHAPVTVHFITIIVVVNAVVVTSSLWTMLVSYNYTH